MPEESAAGGGVPCPTDELGLGAGVDDSALGLADVGSGDDSVGEAEVDSVGAADSLLGSGDGVGDALVREGVGHGVGVGADEVGVGVGEAASVSLSEGSGVAVSEGVSDAVSEGVSDGAWVGLSLGGCDVRLGRESDGVGRVGRSLGSVMLPLPQPVATASTSTEPPSAAMSLERTPTTPPHRRPPPQAHLSTARPWRAGFLPSRDLAGRIGRRGVVGWAAYDEEGA